MGSCTLAQPLAEAGPLADAAPLADSAPPPGMTPHRSPEQSAPAVLKRTRGAQQNVGGLKVRMHQAEFVHVGQSREHKSQNAQHFKGDIFKNCQTSVSKRSKTRPKPPKEYDVQEFDNVGSLGNVTYRLTSASTFVARSDMGPDSNSLIATAVCATPLAMPG